MKIVIIGAGASLEEAIRLGVAENMRPPLINNFGRRLWNSNLALPKSLYDYMAGYLRSIGHEADPDPITTFLRLEETHSDSINVERFFEYAWLHQDESYQGAWGDLLYGGVVNPLVCMFAENGFHENGVGWRQFKAYQAMANQLSAGDLVVNLNYEPLFEMGANQAGRSFSYIPNQPRSTDLLVAKPHGSINLIVEKDSFWFSEADIIGSITTPSEHMEMFRGIIPPRYNKSYQQHPIATIILDSIRNLTPESVTFWGVGFASSDADLIELYKGWCSRVPVISVIHPDPTTELTDAEKLLHRTVLHFRQPEEWVV